MAYTPLQLAEAFLRTGELADALEALDTHLAAEPDDDAARRLRAAALLRVDDENSLRRALDDLAELATPEADDFARRSVICERLSDPSGALAAARRALELRPADERLSERLASLLAAQGDLTGALAVVRSQPRTWRWLEYEGDLLARSGDYVTATARYGLALFQLEARPADDPLTANLRAAMLLKRADAYRRLDHATQAEADLDAAAAIIPVDPFIPFLRGLLCAMRGDPDGALALCGPALTHASEPLRAEMRRILEDPRFATLARAIHD